MTARARRFVRKTLGMVVVLLLLELVVARAVSIDFPTREAPAVPRQVGGEPSPTSATTEGDRQMMVAHANELIDRYVAASSSTGAVLVAFGDEVRLERSFGLARGTDTPLTFGSLPKMLTGYLVQRLAERGTLRLDQHVSELVPELEGTPAGTPTVSQLLHMTSGLPNTFDLVTTVRGQLSRAWVTEEEIIEVLRGYSLVHAPGTTFLYSNVGYRLLAVIATRATKRDWREWPLLLREIVFEPAGMKTTGVLSPDAPPPSDLPSGHLPYRSWLLGGSPRMLELPRWNYSLLWGAGAVWSQASDWVAWTRFLRRLERDEPGLFARYTAAELHDYASGIESKTFDVAGAGSQRVYFHGGEDPGYTGYFVWLPHDDVTIVWLSNTDYGWTSDYELGGELRALFLGAPYRIVTQRMASGEKDRASGATTSASSANVQAKWDEMVPKLEEAPKLPASWTDPKVVAALAERCEYRPMLPLPPNAGDLRPNRFLCAKGSAPPAADAGRDLCHPYEYACEERCKGQCESCGKGCVDACKTCVQPCSDAGSRGDCKNGCATTCAECNESCTTKWESCNAADCTKEHDACAARLTTLWEKNDCATRCRTYSSCAGQCSGAGSGVDTGKCLAKCTAAVAPGLPACLDKCAYVVSPEHEVCKVKCYETAPCAPALCRDQPAAH